MSTTFDPSAFMNSTVDQPMATDFQAPPEGEARAVIGDFDESATKAIQFTYRNGPKTGQPGEMVVFEIPFLINDEEYKKRMGRTGDVKVSARCILQFEDDGRLSTAPDRNVLLGQIRAAVGQNQPGVPFSNLRGQGPVIVRITHEKDDKNPERKYARVTRVAPLR